LLHYHSLKQKEGETGAEFVDREQREYLALREMGINVDDSLRLTKFIQQDTTNSKHRSLAQTIYSTPAMTSIFFVEYLYYYVRWCASLQPPTICAKSSSAYNA
jgi:hypothetical protein